MKSLRTLPFQSPKPYPRTPSFASTAVLLFARGAFAQAGGNSPWENAVNVLQAAFTGPIAKGLALVAIVVGGITYAFGEGGANRTFAGIVFGVGMAVLAVKFFSLARQAKCVPLVATQSISSLQSALPGDAWRTLLQTFRTKIFLALSDEFSARIASELCGQEDRWRVHYNISESGHDSHVSYLTGKPLADKAHISTSKTYSQQREYRFDRKAFTELRNAQSITLAYDGLDPLPPMICYLKPSFNDVNQSYFEQLAEGRL